MAEAGPETLDFPLLLCAAEEKSAEQQRLFYGMTGAQLVALSIASLSAQAPSNAIGGMGPIATLLLFLLVMALQISGIANKSERRWYDARAAAESIKSASWQFAVGGESFRIDDSNAPMRFSELLRDVLHGLPSLDIGSASSKNAAVTTTMRGLRAADLSERAEVYLRERVQDQVIWYSSKAAWNKAKSRRYGAAALLVEAAAVILGILRVQGSIETDYLSVFAACAAGLVGWSQSKKYASLSEAYGVTSHEVSLVADSLETTGSEEAWAQSVHDAEAAFSREHTMWRARRQGPK